MSENPYKAPESELIESRSDEQLLFYVVTKYKLVLLFVATFGTYALFWVFMNWRNYKLATGRSIWPLPRSLFQIFFTHSLYYKIDEQLTKKNIEHVWSPTLLATAYVFVEIIWNAIDFIPHAPIYSVFIFLAIQLAILINVQTAINASQRDPTGSSNSNITLYNVIWVVLGLAYWVAIGYYLFDKGVIATFL